MSSIVAYKEFELLRLSRHTQYAGQGEAEILLFTGVQYERTETIPPGTDDTPLRRSVATKRKRKSF